MLLGDCPCSCWSCTWLFVVVLLLWTDMRNGVIYTSTSLSSVLLYVHRDCMDYYSISLGTGSPGWPPWLSHSFWALSSPLALVWDLWYWCAQYEPAGAIIVWVSGYYIYMTTKKTVQSFLHCLSQQDDESSVKCGWYHMQMNGGKLVMRLEIDVGSKLPLTLFDGTYPWPGSCQSWYVLTIDLASWHQRDRDRAWETT